MSRELLEKLMVAAFVCVACFTVYPISLRGREMGKDSEGGQG